MRRCRLLCCLIVVVLGCHGQPAAEGGVFGGTVKAVSKSAGTMTVAASSNRTETFTIGDSTPVSLDGKPARFGDLKTGMRVSVFTNANGRVLRVRALRKAATPSKSARPKKPKRPQKTAKTPLKTGGDPEPQAVPAGSNEWNQFRGPNRDNISLETGLLKSWPAGGPKLVWTARGLGEGYSGVSVSKGMIYTMGNRGDDEMVIALDIETGKEVWATRSGRAYHESRGNGPRSTPTIDGKLVYSLGANGDLCCLAASDGSVKWRKNILTEFGGRNNPWGICESVLIDGGKLICTPGGRGATVVALNKTDGKLLWKAAVPGNPSSGYASPIVADPGGLRQYVVFTARGVIGVRAEDGRYLWGNSASSNGTANCSTPLYYEGYVFSASNYGQGGALLRLLTRGRLTTAKQVYHTRDMKNHHGGMVILDGYLYGSNGGILTCLQLVNGRVKWRQRTGKGSLTYADGRIYFRSESGPVTLLEATADGYREHGKFRQPDRSRKPSWPHPVVADGKLFLRDMDVLLCYDVKAGE